MCSADRRRAASTAIALVAALTVAGGAGAQGNEGKTFTFQGGGSFDSTAQPPALTEGGGPPPIDQGGPGTPPPLTGEAGGPPPLTEGETTGPPALTESADGPPPLTGTTDGPPPVDQGPETADGPPPENGTHMPGGPWPAVPGAPEQTGPETAVVPPDIEAEDDETEDVVIVPEPPERPEDLDLSVTPTDPLLAFELQDFGVQATSQIHQGAPHAPTPTAIPGGRLITTRELSPMATQKNILLVDVLGAGQTLPNAINATGMGNTGYPEQQMQAQVQSFMARYTGGRKDVPIVIFCSDPMCWLSYNASLRVIRAGYSQVLWYRGGLEAWRRAGNQLVSAQGGWQ